MFIHNTLGFHFVKSTYGQWLPGDERGSWSEAWDSQIGFHEPHMLHPGDPVRLRMAKERMKHDPLWLTDEMKAAVVDAIHACIERSRGSLSIAACTIEATHFHLLIPYSTRDIDGTAGWIADQTTKAVHRRTSYCGPVWCKGKWCEYIYNQQHWDNAIEYIERHNERHGRGVRPHEFVTVVR